MEVTLTHSFMVVLMIIIELTLKQSRLYMDRKTALKKFIEITL